MMHGHIVRALYQYLIDEIKLAGLLPSELAKLSPFVLNLREEFRVLGKDVGEVNKAIYHSALDEDALLKTAYSLIYVPSYAFQAGCCWFLLFDKSATLLETAPELEIVSIGGGPLPEMIGLVDAICRRLDPRKCALKTIRWLSLDVNTDWAMFASISANVARRILAAAGFVNLTIDLNCAYFDVTEPIDAGLLRFFEKQTYVISQNLLNEIPHGSRTAVVQNFTQIADTLAPGSALLFSYLTGYEESVLQTVKIIAKSLSEKSRWMLLHELDHAKRPGTRSAVRSPFWAARAGEVDPWSPVPSAISQLIGFNDDGRSKAKRNLWCGFRVLVN